MKIKLATMAVALLLSGGLCAAPAAIVFKGGKTAEAYSIDSQTISGVNWQKDRGKAEARAKLWEVDGINYRGQGMDEFNGMPRKLSGGQGAKLIADAQRIIGGAAAKDFSKEDWDFNVVLTCKYYLAQGHRLNRDHGAAIKAFEEFFADCEKAPVTTGILPINYKSSITGKPVTNAGGMNRYYLDALEAYVLCLLQEGKADAAREKGIKSLQDLCDELSGKSGDNIYHDWTIRALRNAARFAEGKEDWKTARASYEALIPVALKRGDNKPNRAAKEAQLKVGFMQIKEGDARGANARFYEATHKWESAHNTRSAAVPRGDWINADEAYMAAGSYVGQGLVKSADAKNANDWAEALKNFSMALSIFQSDDEIRSMALLGAATACAKMADLNKATETVASNHAKLAEKYLAELLNLLPKSRAAEDDSVTQIQQVITKYKKGD